VAGAFSSWSQQRQLWEPFSEAPAIDGGKSIRLHLRVGSDDEVGHEMLPRAARLSIVFEDQSGEVGCGWCDGRVGDGKLPQKRGQTRLISGGRCQFCKGNGTDDQRPFRRDIEKSVEPLFVSGVLPDDGPKDQSIKRGDDDSQASVSTGPPLRS